MDWDLEHLNQKENLQKINISYPSFEPKINFLFFWTNEPARYSRNFISFSTQRIKLQKVAKNIIFK